MRIKPINIIIIIKFTVIILLMNFNSFVIDLYCQTLQLNFESIGLEQGLSQSTIYAITQDALGFMWFGTQDGLNRYDGYNIEVLNNIKGNSLSYNVIWSIISDKDSNLWIGTERGGVDIYLHSQNKFINLKNDPSSDESISENFITTLFEDSHNNIWIGTQSKGINLYDKLTNKIKRINVEKDGLAGNSIRTLCEDDQNNLWIGTSSGISKINLDTFYKSGRLNLKNYKFDSKNDHSLSSNNVWCIYHDSKGRIWVGTWGGGLNLYVPDRDNFIRIYNKSGEQKAIPSNMIKAIIEDTDGNLWLGTYDMGLILFDVKNKTYYKLNIDDFIVSLFKDRTGNIWIGTFSSGVKMFSKRKNLFKTYFGIENQEASFKRTIISSILETVNGDLIVGTYGDGLMIFNSEKKLIKKFIYEPANPNSLSHNRITAIVQSKDGRIWIATNGGGLNLLDLKTKKFKHYNPQVQNSNSILYNQISTLAYNPNKNKLYIGYFQGGISSLDLNNNKFTHFIIEDMNDKSDWQSPITTIFYSENYGLWVANFKGYLFRYDINQNKFKRFLLPFKEEKKIYNGIYCIVEDDDNLWFATYGDGLYKLNLKENSLEIFNENNSGVKNVIYGILKDEHGNLWGSSNKGIFKFNIQNKSIKYYDKSDGLQSNEFNQGAFYKNSRGEIFFGGVNGLNSFYPDKIINNEYIPPVYITKFKILNEPLELRNPIPDGTVIQIPYSKNFFSFEFVALNYIIPDKNQYLYKLEGFDKQWNRVFSTYRFGSYTNLNPGKYILRIIASNNDGIWNKQGTFITIIITPPYWMTWWFVSLLIVTVISIIFGIFRIRINSLKKEKLFQEQLSSKLIEKQEEERSRIAQEMHDNLGQELLFIKNRALLTMQKFPDNQLLIEHLKMISDSVTSLLKKVREISHNLRPPELDRLGLTETIKSILQKARESSTINIMGEIDDIDNLLNKKDEINLIRIIQEAINNVLKHSGAKICKVTIQRANDLIKLEILDNGKGFNIYNITSLTPRSIGLGITGIFERVKILKGTINFESSPLNGTKIIINIPIDSKNG